MKKINIVIVFIIMYLININVVFAEACDNKTQVEINTAASNVTMNYEIETKVMDFNNNVHEELDPNEVEIKEYGGSYYLEDFITLKVENITDKIYVEFSSIADNINIIYHYEDLDNGSFTYQLDSNDRIRDFTLTIYSNIGECLGEEVNKIELTTPKYNLSF